MVCNFIAKKIVSILIIFISTSTLADEPILGKWLVVNSQTGQVKAIMEFKKDIDNTISGSNIKFIDENLNKNNICSKCPEPFRDKPLLGTKVVWGLKKAEKYGEYVNGYALDAMNGKIYNGKAKVTNDGRRLNIRGYASSSLLGRTEVWLRAPD